MSYTSKETYAFISRETADPIVKRETCHFSGHPFAIFQSDIDFLKKIVVGLPGQGEVAESRRGLLPTLCPEERQRRRMAWRNERNIFKRTCSFSGEQMVSMYPADVPFPVYRNKYWRSDAHDPLVYGSPIDFKRPVFTQLRELQTKVPRIQRFSYAEDRMVNAEYTNGSGDLKDSYLCFATGIGEGLLYCDYTAKSNFSVDSLLLSASENCYACVNCDTCYQVFRGENCVACRECIHVVACTDCTSCLCCVGLTHASYCIFNVQYTKEEWLTEKQRLTQQNYILSPDEHMRFDTLLATTPKKACITENNDRTRGNYTKNTKNSSFCYDTNNAENCKYCTRFFDGANCQDFYARGEAERCYEISGGGEQSYRSAFCASIFGAKNCYYCDLCFYCSDCFCCIGLKYKQYCIFNKQYTKEEYDILVPKIIEHMQTPSTGSGGERGEFFPIATSPHAYNHSVAQEYYAQSENEAKERGWNRFSREELFDIAPEIESINAIDLPRTSLAVDASLCKKAIICEKTGKPFRITQKELALYQQLNLPLPRIHRQERQRMRLQSRGERTLHCRTCEKCGKEMVSVHKPSPTLPYQGGNTVSSDNPAGLRGKDGGVCNQRIYCEVCYNQEIYG